MATRIDRPVTLSVEEATRVIGWLQELASENASLAKKTRVAAVRGSCVFDSARQHQMIEKMLQAMYTWE